MLSTRLWMGGLLVVVTAGMLFIDRHVSLYPFLLVFVMALGIAACRELIQMLGQTRRPDAVLCYIGVAMMASSNWLAHVSWQNGPQLSAWPIIVGIYVVFVLSVFVYGIATYAQTGRSVERLALTIWVVTYLGLLPCFLVQLRWFFLPGFHYLGDLNPRIIGDMFGSGPRLIDLRPDACTTLLALAIFVPKAGDIGAYCFGRLFGRHKMTPVLSPNKTWEGTIAGMVCACLASVAINRYGPASVWSEPLLEIAFGYIVGMAGILGDLAESLIKRDCQAKDASQTVPGFGGVLDVVDSVIFSAPVSYFFFAVFAQSP